MLAKKMPVVLCNYWAKSGNLGDELVSQGLRKRLNINAPFFYEDDGIPKATRIIITGSPWLWTSCTNSSKYNWLKEVLRLNPRSQFEAYGIGSCLPYWDYDARRILDDEYTKRELKSIWSRFCHIEVRDELAYKIFNALDIEPRLEPCPSVYLAENLGSKYSVLFFNYPAGVSSQTLEYLPSQYKNKFLEYQLEKVKVSDKVYYHYSPLDDSDGEWLKSHGIEAEAISSIEEYVKATGECRSMISGRVHPAVLSAYLAKPTEVIVGDSRYLTATLIGATAKFIVCDEVWKD